MRVLIFHGYLLSGTGSNVYNARLAMALRRLGHDVHLLCQDRHPEEQGFVDAAGDWDTGELRVRTLERPLEAGRGEDSALGSCTVYRPNIGALLPVYVADSYEGIEAKTFADCSDGEIERYLDANVAAVRAVVELVRPELALANHLVMGPAILARALAGSGISYAVKVHGSALEYTVKPQPGRFLGFAREGLAPAAGVLVGSHHTAASLWHALAGAESEDQEPDGSSPRWLVARTRLGPPGVDVERFRPLSEPKAAECLIALEGGLRARVHAGAHARAQPPFKNELQTHAFTRDDREAAAALARLDPVEDRLVAFVGKLIVSKGVDLLLAAWPLVLAEIPDAKLLITGFGAYRQPLEQLLDALTNGDLARAEQMAVAGRSLETGSAVDAQPLRHLLAFLNELSGAERERYIEAAGGLSERVVFAGRLDHEELAEILPACEAIVVPSTFPEAFGMVAVEGAACGAFPISAGHSGLSEVSDVLAAAIPAEAAAWLSFPVDDGAVRALAGNLTSWLRADEALRSSTRAGLVRTARERWSWEGVARGVIAAGRGELDELAEP